MTKDQRDARRNEGKRLRREQGRAAHAQAQAEQSAAKQDALRPDVSWHCCSWDDSLQPEHPLRLEYEALLRGDLLAAVEHRIHYIEVSSLGNYIAPEDAAALRELAAAGAVWSPCSHCDGSNTCRCPEGPRGWLLSEEQRASILAQREAAEQQIAERRAAREAAEAAAAAEMEEEEQEHAEDLTQLNAMLEANGRESIDDDEFDAFCEWAERPWNDVPVNADTYLELWLNDEDGGEAFHFQRRIDKWACNADIEEQQQEQQVASGAPPPPPPPSSSTVVAEEQEPWMSRHPLANYGSNLGDWQPSGGEHVMRWARHLKMTCPPKKVKRPLPRRKPHRPPPLRRRPGRGSSIRRPSHRSSGSRRTRQACRMARHSTTVSSPRPQCKAQMAVW